MVICWSIRSASSERTELLGKAGSELPRAPQCNARYDESMPNSIESTIETYVQAWSERDPVLRASLIEACFAPQGRIVTRGREIVGRAAFADSVAKLHADPEFLRARLTSAIEVGQTSFRFSGVVERRDGSLSVESFDSGEVDGAGRISLLLTFTGPLAPRAEPKA